MTCFLERFSRDLQSSFDRRVKGLDPVVHNDAKLQGSIYGLAIDSGPRKILLKHVSAIRDCRNIGIAKPGLGGLHGSEHKFDAVQRVGENADGRLVRCLRRSLEVSISLSWLSSLREGGFCTVFAASRYESLSADGFRP
jgi:hypothetical protein